MGSIKKTKAGTFRVRWYDQNGRQQGKTLPTKPAAKTFLKQVEGKVASGEFLDPRRGRIPLRDWIDTCRSTDFDLEPGTVDVEERAAKRLNDALGDILLVNLTPEDIQAYIAGRLNEGAASGYVSIEFRALRKWLNRAVRMDKIPKSPTAELAAPKSSAAEMHFLTMEELVALAEAMPDRYRAWAYVMGTAGLRYSEAAGLRRARVRERKLEIVEQLVFRNGQWTRKSELKTVSSRRSVSLGPKVAGILDDHLDTYSLPGQDGLVFPNRNGGPILPSAFTVTFKRALARAGLDPTIRIHDLRHTSVALAIAAGAHPTAIQRRLGHSSITVTLGTYGHLFPELDEALAADVDLALAARLPEFPGGPAGEAGVTEDAPDD